MKVKILCLCLLLALALLICGCATTTKIVPPFNASTPPEGRAIVYFYRPAEFVASMVAPKVFDNNNYVFALANGKYVEYVTNPGRHEFKTDTMNIDEPVSFAIKPDETHYLRLDYKMGTFIGTWLLTRKYPEQALEEIKFCKDGNAK